MTEGTKFAGTGLHIAPVYLEHDTGQHPESPDRIRVLQTMVDRAHFSRRLTGIAGRMAEDEDLLLCHTPSYLRLVREETSSNRRTLSTGDTAICERSYDIARHAAGAVIACVDAVMDGTVCNAFCAVRPPGHHASAAAGMGFCVFNNVAIGARHAQRRRGAERIAIVDWDVHHGNGTQEIFYSDGSVLFFSVHQSPWYPGTGSAEETGEGPGRGLTINCPFPAGAGREQILPVFLSKLLPALDEFRPDLILISAGFDSRESDPLGRFLLQDDDFAEMTRLVTEAAAKHCQGRLVSVLEGGYALAGLDAAVQTHLDVLLCAGEAPAAGPGNQRGSSPPEA